MLGIITVLELSAGALSAIGCLIVLVRRDPTIAYYGAVLSGLALLALFSGSGCRKIVPVQRC